MAFPCCCLGDGSESLPSAPISAMNMHGCYLGDTVVSACCWGLPGHKQRGGDDVPTAATPFSPMQPTCGHSIGQPGLTTAGAGLQRPLARQEN